MAGDDTLQLKAATDKWEAEIVRLGELIEEQKKERLHLRAWPVVGLVLGPPIGYFTKPFVGVVAFVLSIVAYFTGYYLTAVHMDERRVLLETARDELEKARKRAA